MHKIPRIILFIAFLLGQAPCAYSAPQRDVSPGSVLPLELDAEGIPFYLQLLIDPRLKERIPTNEEALSILNIKITADRKALLLSKEKKDQINTQLLEKLLLQSYYWQLQAAGQKPKSKDLATIQQQLRETHNEILSLGAQVLSGQKSLQYLTALTFQMALVRAQYPDTRKEAINNLKTIRSDISHPAELDLVDFLLALEDLYDSNPKSRPNAIRRLENTSNRLDRRYSSVAHLAIARNLAGLSLDGKPQHQATSTYANHLKYVSKFCKYYNDDEKNSLFDFGVSIWRLQKRAEKNPHPVPFAIDCFDQCRQFPAFLERIAEIAEANSDIDRAQIIYEEIKKKTPNQAQKQLIDFKLIMMLRQEFLAGRRRDVYERALSRSQSMFPGTEYEKTIQEKYTEFMRKELADGTKSKIGDTRFRALRSSMEKYLKAAADNPETHGVRFQWADVLLTQGAWQDAVGVLLSLAQGSSGIVRGRFLERSLGIQLEHMRWDLSEPFTNSNVTDLVNLNNLRQILILMSENLKSTTSIAPPSSQHAQSLVQIRLNLAIVERQLGLHETARSNLRQVFERIPSESDRELAATILIEYALAQKDYTELENLSYICQKNNIALSKSVGDFKNINDIYIHSLDKQADILVASRQLPKALIKLKTLISYLKPSEKRSHRRYLLARCYQDLRRFEESKSEFEAILEEASEGEALRRTLLDYAALQMAQGELGDAIKIYERYTESFSEDARTHEAHIALIEGYIALKRWSEAREKLLMLLQARDLDDRLLVTLDKKLIQLYQSSMNPAWIAKDIEVLTKLQPDRPDFIARLIGILINSRSNYELIKNYNSQASPETSTFYVVGDVRSQLSFHEAERMSQADLNSINSAILQDDPNVLRKIQTTYQQRRNSYSKVCLIPYASYCGPAIYATLLEAQKYRAITMNLNLSRPTPEISTLKKYLTTFFNKEIEDLSGRLQNIVQKGNSPPHLIAEITGKDESFWRYTSSLLVGHNHFLILPKTMSQKTSLAFAKGDAE